MSSRIGLARIEIDDDRAVVNVSGAGLGTIELRRVEGERWRVTGGELFLH